MNALIPKQYRWLAFCLIGVSVFLIWTAANMTEPDIVIERDGERQEIYRIAQLVPLPAKISRDKNIDATERVRQRFTLKVPLPKSFDLKKLRDSQVTSAPGSEDFRGIVPITADPVRTARALAKSLPGTINTKPGEITVESSSYAGDKIWVQFTPDRSSAGKVTNVEVRLTEPN